MTLQELPFRSDAKDASSGRWWALGCLCLSLVLITANNSSLNVNLPSLQRALHASNSELQWVVDAYGLGGTRATRMMPLTG
jgi:hypothetical protein